MADRELSFPTSIGTSDERQIHLLGQDLSADLMGKVGFGELAYWLVAGRRRVGGGDDLGGEVEELDPGDGDVALALGRAVAEQAGAAAAPGKISAAPA